MKENQEELDKEMTDAQPEPEIDVEAAEDSGISEAEAEEFETAKLKAELEEMEDMIGAFEQKAIKSDLKIRKAVDFVVAQAKEKK